LSYYVLASAPLNLICGPDKTFLNYHVEHDNSQQYNNIKYDVAISGMEGEALPYNGDKYTGDPW